MQPQAAFHDTFVYHNSILLVWKDLEFFRVWLQFLKNMQPSQQKLIVGEVTEPLYLNMNSSTGLPKFTQLREVLFIFLL
jgi:hypothetical protein